MPLTSYPPAHTLTAVSPGGWGRVLATCCVPALVMTLTSCNRDYPATADVKIRNDTGTSVQVDHCTFSCKADDLQDRQSIAPSAEIEVGVNGDPSVKEPFVITGPTVHCLYVDASRSLWMITSATPAKGTCPREPDSPNTHG